MYSGHAPDWNDEEWTNAGRNTTCNAQGNFEFNQLPASNWYVLVLVAWQVAGESEHGTLVAPVATQASQHLRLLLTDANLVAQ
jgi:hypothetical protein